MSSRPASRHHPGHVQGASGRGVLGADCRHFHPAQSASVWVWSLATSRRRAPHSPPHVLSCTIRPLPATQSTDGAHLAHWHPVTAAGQDGGASAGPPPPGGFSVGRTGAQGCRSPSGYDTGVTHHKRTIITPRSVDSVESADTALPQRLDCRHRLPGRGGARRSRTRLPWGKSIRRADPRGEHRHGAKSVKRRPAAGTTEATKSTHHRRRPGRGVTRRGRRIVLTSTQGRACGVWIPLVRGPPGLAQSDQPRRARHTAPVSPTQLPDHTLRPPRF